MQVAVVVVQEALRVWAVQAAAATGRLRQIPLTLQLEQRIEAAVAAEQEMILALVKTEQVAQAALA